MFWKIAAGALALLGGYFGIRYLKEKHRHTDACPSTDAVKQWIADVESNRVAIETATSRADSWDAAGCGPAAVALRAMIKVRQIKEGAIGLGAALVNWIPGCTPPSSFMPPEGWSLGVTPTSSIPGWTMPPGWKVGDPLPAGWACPPGWTSEAKAEPIGAEKAGFAAVGTHKRVHPKIARLRR